jgi:hypothetical protein
MTNTAEYATYIIDLTDAMLNHRRGLSPQQINHLETIQRRAVEFITSFFLHEKADLDTLHNYLSYDAIQPISIIIGYSEYMLIGAAENMLPTYREAVEELRDCGYALRDDIQDMLADLLEFMENIGYESKSQAQSIQPVQKSQAKVIQPLAPRTASQEDATQPSRLIQPLAPKTEQKPIQRLQPLP